MATVRAVYKKDLCVKENWHLFIAMMPSEVSGKMVETKCSGVFAPIYEGQPFTFVGEYESYKGCKTFRVKSYAAEMPKGMEESMAFIRSIKGIGKKRGDIISSYCNGDLTRLTMDDVEKLKALCPNLKEANLRKLIDRLNQVKAIGELQKTYGAALTVEQLSKIVAKFENRVERIMTYHPYWTDSVVGFAVADVIGGINGVAANDVERVASAAKHVLNAICRRNGSAMAGTADVINGTSRLLSATKLGGVSDADIRKAMNQMLDDRIIAHNGGYVYPRKNLQYEREIASFVADNTGKVSVDKQQAFQTAFSKWVSSHKDIQLSSKQTSAVWTAGVNRLSVITGGPGTGKTTTLGALIDSYADAFPDSPITLIAPTGLAAKRMAEKTGREAKTIHSTFRLIPVDEIEKDDFESDYNDNLIQAIDDGLIVIDEFSMVGLDLAAFVLKHISSKCQLVVVGDADQLPPIAAGSVLLALIQSNVVPVTTLDRNYRQTNSTGIPELAADINQGVSDIHFVGGCSFMAMTEDKINKSLTDKYLDAVGRYGIKNVLVLAPTRKESDRTGAICTDNLNQMLRSAANPASEGKKEMKIGERIFRVGDRVINTKNATDCVNGDIGTIASITADGESMTVEFDGGFEVIFDKKRVSKAIELSYAVTVHKSQGGEYDCILMPFVESQSFVLTKALIYTAVTRARKEFIGIGKLELMQTASTRTCKNNGPKDLLVKRIASMLKKREVIAVECSDSNSNKAA